MPKSISDGKPVSKVYLSARRMAEKRYSVALSRDAAYAEKSVHPKRDTATTPSPMAPRKES